MRAGHAAKTTTVYIGLGSNLQNPPEQIRLAIGAMGKIPQTRVVADSGLFLSKPMVPPMGPVQQPDYYNAVVKIETGLGPYELLDHLQQIENTQQRKRRQHWGPRTIDLDILMFDNVQSNDERLTLPHPGLHQREFVLYPLHIIDPALVIPGHGMLSELIKRCPDNGLQYLGTIEGYRE
jgi:2-amino-4-hydroxy-6-hydroxymethyldihydropteridine diphosphokinase